MTDQVEKWWRDPNPKKDWTFVYDPNGKNPTEIVCYLKETRKRDEEEPSDSEKSDNNILNDFIRKRKLRWIPYKNFDEVEYLDKGGFGVVHKAFWPEKKMRVALKSLNVKEESLETFLREWEHHESCLFSYEIVNFFGFTNGPEGFMAVMELANKGSLFGNLEKIARSSWKEKLYVLFKISTGLCLMHATKLIHRDLHYGNILINTKDEKKAVKFVFGENDDVWISDLGFCKSINSLLEKEKFYGNTPFLAPEVIRSKDYGKESDVYSFAILMWTLTSGTIPYKGSEDGHNLSIGICQGTRPNIITTNTPKCYQSLMERCWNTDKSKRPSADEVNRTIMNWILRPKETTKEQADNIKEFIKADEESVYDNDTKQTPTPSKVIDTNTGEQTEFYKSSSSLESLRVGK